MFVAFVLAATVTADGLIAEVVQRAQESAHLRFERGLAGIKHEQEHDTNESPERLAADKKFRLAMSPQGFLHQLVMRDGRTVSGMPLEAPEIDPTRLILTMQEKYTFRLASPEPVDGYYSVSFDPKNPPAPSANDKEAVINRLSGIIYIDEHRKYVRRFQAWLEKSFSIKAIGKVHEASALLDQEMVEDMPVPRRSVFSVRYSKAVLWTTATRTTVEYAYDPLPPLPPVISSPAP